MCKCKDIFISLDDQNKSGVKIGNGDSIPGRGSGQIAVKSANEGYGIQLKNTKLVPEMCCNIMATNLLVDTGKYALHQTNKEAYLYMVDDPSVELRFTRHPKSTLWFLVIEDWSDTMTKVVNPTMNHSSLAKEETAKLIDLNDAHYRLGHPGKTQLVQTLKAREFDGIFW